MFASISASISEQEISNPQLASTFIHETNPRPDLEPAIDLLSSIENNHLLDNETTNNLFESTFQYNPQASHIEPSHNTQNTDLSFSPPPIRKKLFKRPTLSNSKANGSFRNELSLSQNETDSLVLSELSRTQKGGLSLIVDHNNLKYKYVIASHGISQKGIVSWNCSSRKCKSKIKTKISPKLVKTSEVKGKKRFFFNDPTALKLDDFEIEQQIVVAHECEPLSTKDIFDLKISAKALEIAQKQNTENPTRKLLRSEILDQATDIVRKTMPEPTEPLKMKKLNMKRKISRCLQKNGSEVEDITHENFEEYNFDGMFQESEMRLDVSFAQQTNNAFLLFYSLSVLLKLGSGNFNFLGDGTFPLGKGNVFEQVFIGLISNKDVDQIAFFVWMKRRRKEDYRKVLLWIQNKIGTQIKVMRIVTDREIALYSALSEIFVNTGENRCCFHALQNFRRRFENEGLKSLMPAKNRKINTQNACFVSHCWHCVQFMCYFPIGFISNHIDFLVNNVINVLDPRLEEKLKTVLLSIKMDFSNDRELSWLKKTLIIAETFCIFCKFENYINDS